jgi:phage tail-like protein
MPEAAQQGQEQGAAAQTGVWIDPYRAYNFKLEIQGVTEGHFTECSGIGVKVDVISYREGGNSQILHRLPGPVSYADVTLRYGLTNSAQMWEWFLSAVKGKVDRRNISIILMDNDGTTEVMRWNLENAWIAEWRGAPLDASGREVAVEMMTLVYETLNRG